MDEQQATAERIYRTGQHNAAARRIAQDVAVGRAPSRDDTARCLRYLRLAGEAARTVLAAKTETADMRDDVVWTTWRMPSGSTEYDRLTWASVTA